MDVPAEILVELKCETCGVYLSRSPVFVHQNMSGVCNQCVPPEHRSTRNKQYESVAKLLKFPCRYQELGCPSTVPFVECTSVIPHEEECSFRQYPCLVLGSNDCDFLGNRDEMLAHCRQQHADHVVESPVTLTHDINQSNMRTYLLVAFKLLFLLNTKVCVTSGKIFHAVHLLGDSTKAEDFSFTVDVKRNGAGVSKTGKVAPESCLANQEAIPVAISINSLLDMLGGFSDIIFTVALERLRTVKELTSCAKCYKDVVEFYYKYQNKWWCEECAPKIQICDNHSQGCTYKDIPVKHSKHKDNFCIIMKRCPICRKDKDISEDTLFKHFKSVHKALLSENGSIWFAIPNSNWQYRLISSVAGIALCRYNNQAYSRSTNRFTLDVFIPVASDCLSEFCCTVTATCPNTNAQRTFNADLLYNFDHDWHFEILSNELSYSKGFDISVNITKI